MNKTKKITTAVVSVVMAGTIASSLAGCTPGNTTKNLMSNFENFMNQAWQTALSGYGSESSSSNQEKLNPHVDGNGKLTYAANTELNTAIGYDSSKTGIKYTTDETSVSALIGYLGGYEGSSSTVQLYGKQYSSGSLKPAWQTLSDTLGIKVNDSFSGVSSNSQMSAITGLANGLSTYQVFTASATDINNQGASGKLLNITDYLEYMPNYAAFLEANPLTRLSLTADENGSMYMLPYFDGNDDIEKYVLLEKNLVEILLDTANLEGTDNTITFKAQADAKNAISKYSDKGIVSNTTSVESFMGTTGSWEVETTDPEALDSTKTPNWGNDLNVAKIATGQGSTTTVVVNYDAALTAAQDVSKPLGAAISAAAGTAYTGTSGNIVDLQNFAINAKSGAVKGSALLNILREYIKVAYQDKGGNQFYTKLSDVFNSAYAAWDVDLYVALGRCFTTCGSLLSKSGIPLVKSDADLFLLSGREYKANRYSDVYAIAGELYGVRGLESRYSPTYAYVNSEGKISDSRLDVATWEALDNMNKLAKEGLLNAMTTDNIGKGGYGSSNDASNTGVQTLSLHDYVQTQTANIGFKTQNSNLDASIYNFAPVLTPVSHWDTNDDGTADTTMRFTESWRSVKNTGWCISYDAVKSNSDKLSAALALVDYFFSNDGQILMTYGPQGNADDDGSTTACKTEGNGFWYANKVTGTVEGVALDTNADGSLTDTTLKALVTAKVLKTNDNIQYYANPGDKDANGNLINVYEDDYFVYKNTLYTGSYYKGRMIPTLTKSALVMFEASSLGDHSFTNYARYYIGSALNIGNKDQGFEYQCTADCGIVGADIVNIALVNGTIRHTEQLSPDEAEANDSWWYMLTPTLLPYKTAVNNVITTAPYTIITALGGAETSLFKVDGSVPNLLNDVMAYGLGSGHLIRTMNNGDKIPNTAAELIVYLNNIN
ncbi:MAG: hypothetical protein K2J83_00295 [Clostridia bacterium]|nr:hypothetical protein [Clostridia bacterium]